MRTLPSIAAGIIPIALIFVVSLWTNDDPAAAENLLAPTKNDWTRVERYALRQDKKGNKEGGTGAPKCVKLALDWLVRHQAPDGQWSTIDYQDHCRKPVEPCANEQNWHQGTGPGFPGFDVGVTGLALLAFAGRGNTHIEAEKPKYQKSIESALTWVLAQQFTAKDDPESGAIGRVKDTEEWFYNHAIATIALGELLIGSGDKERLAEPFRQAIELCLRAQNPGYGWKYTVAGGTNDTSVTVWMAMAILTAKSCVEAKLIDLDATKLEESLAGAEKWILRATAQQSGRVGYVAPGDEGSRLQGVYGEKYPYAKQRIHANTAAAFSFAMLRGRRGVEPTNLWETMLAEHPPEWIEVRGDQKSTINLYYWYYAAHAMFQVGDKPWKAFNRSMKEALRKTQRTRGCEKGSWDPIGEWGIVGGRVYATAIGALTLECYYRYARQPAIERPSAPEPEKKD